MKVFLFGWLVVFFRKIELSAFYYKSRNLDKNTTAIAYYWIRKFDVTQS